MGSIKIIDGNVISDTDPLQIIARDASGNAIDASANGMTSQPDNAQVTLTTGASTAIVAAAMAGTKNRRTLIRCLTSDWYVAEGAAASPSRFLIKAGEGYTSSSLLAINGWPVTGSPTAYVISEAR